MDRCKPEVLGKPGREGETRVGRVEAGQGRTRGIGQTQKGGKCSSERAAIETDYTHIRQQTRNSNPGKEDAKGETKPGELAKNQIVKGLLVFSEVQ